MAAQCWPGLRRTTCLTATVALLLGLQPRPAAADRDLYVEAVNALRQQQGKTGLLPLPESLEAETVAYQARLARQILLGGSCDHDLGRWNAFQTAMAPQRLQPLGEVIACPGQPGTWQPEQLAGQWFESEVHRRVLMERAAASHISCNRFLGATLEVVLCTTWRRP
ncbi:MAG: hypothetical protein K9J72_03430 [Synechococcus sp. Tobar2m-G35]|nr:hypothetical protein [Synechococcus sp. Tobar2m-G35]